jgi:hypothetical protein
MHDPPIYLQARCGLRPDAMHIVTRCTTPCAEPLKIVAKLPCWLALVLSGDMTVHQADAAYGPERTAGRPRRSPTFSHYLADRTREWCG